MKLCKILLTAFFMFLTSVVFAQDVQSVQQGAAQDGGRFWAKAEKKLLGKHLFSLQWISWEKFGTAVITRGKDGLEIDAKQELNGDYVTMKGTIQPIDEKAFMFTGDIITRVYHINKGEECKRSGTFQFKATGNRKYWRMQKIENPCDGVADYVDVYF